MSIKQLGSSKGSTEGTTVGEGVAVESVELAVVVDVVVTELEVDDIVTGGLVEDVVDVVVLPEQLPSLLQVCPKAQTLQGAPRMQATSAVQQTAPDS